MRILLALLAIVAVVAVLAVRPGASASATARAQADAIDMTSSVTYRIRPDDGGSRVSWDITIVNNDPATSAAGEGGFVRFYEGFSFPVLADAKNLSASSGGTGLTVTTTPIEGAPVDQAAVTLHDPLFYGETYTMTLGYDISETRKPSLLVTPNYAFLPILAVGDTATVTVLLPPGEPWATELVPGECAQDGSTFTCTGSDDLYLAALAEVSRPDLTATITTEVPLKEKAVKLSIKYFQGEEAFATHVKDLAINALPVMEDLYGVPYRGSADVQIEEAGRVITLGYEGLAACNAASCEIAVSPVAGDYTVLHELAHMWSNLYSERWLAEGFAEIIARESVSRLPGDLVSGSPGERPQPTTELQLDDWADVSLTAGIDDAEAAIENAGYYRSERFMALLLSQVGIDVLKKANAAIASSGGGATSRRFMDAVEENGGGNNDELFQEWVFPALAGPDIALRRQARDRLSALVARATAEGLSDAVPLTILSDLGAWRFDSAMVRLEEAEAGLQTYSETKGDLEALRAGATAAGLTLSPEIDEAIATWDFEEVADHTEDATAALALYVEAEAVVDAGRNPWETFGMIGVDPDGDLNAAAVAFSEGDYEAATDSARDAIDTVNDASARAARRVMIVAGGAAAFAMLILLGVWYTRLRESRAGQFR